MNNSKNSLPCALIVDDETSVLETMRTILEEEFDILTAKSGKDALDKITKEEIGLVFLDIKMPDMDGIEVLNKIREYDENITVVMATAVDSARSAVKAMQSGAFDYLTKPFNPQEVITVARRTLEQKKLLKEVIYLRSQKEEVRFENIIGKGKKIKEIFAVIEKVAKNNSTIFLSGESGTGKELIARAIHYKSLRNQKPFIPLNCAGIPENLLESELFGYEKGAFTGALCQKLGVFELAQEGTLFLDEVSSLKLDMQAKLLRALEEREIRRLGGNKTIKLDVRIISATNIDLKQAVANARFREDLYYRLKVIPIHLPPLREKREDIPLLTEYFLERFNQAFRKTIEGFSKEALSCLMQYDWPGNIRELKNVIERLVALNDSGIITPAELPFDIFLKCSLNKNSPSSGGLKEAREYFEKQYIEAALERAGGNQGKAAKILKIHRNALFYKIRNLGLKK